MIKSVKAVRGTRDLLPPETALWDFVEETARSLFRAYNFHEIRTPIFENTELFSRSVGEETDIVSKEMYTWNDRPQFTETRLYDLWKGRHSSEFTSITDIASVQEIGVDAVAESGDRVVLVALKSRPFHSTNAVGRWYETADKLRRQWVTQTKKPVELRLVLPVTYRIGKTILPQISSGLFEIEYLDDDELLEMGQALTLRPENTAGVVRAYIEHKLWQRGLNKLYYFGPQFRRERPQKGRYRQFYQIGAEILGPPSAGSESPARDAELLEMLATLLDRLEISDWTLHLNSVGCSNDRAAYNEALREALKPVVSKMCADCQRRAVTNPLRIFDCKVPDDQPIIEKLPRISQFLDDACRQHFQEVQEILKAVEVPFTLNDRLVRGLDYYTRTAFEFTHGALGAQNAILGGGRYDGLSESLGGPQAPGIGFAIGEDRLVLALGKAAEAVQNKPDVYIAPLGAGMNREAARLARELRRHDIFVDLGDENFRLKKSLETASKLGARFALIVGENEVKAQAFALKDLETGEQISVPRAELAKKLQSE
jgi:histidyl-tRNA synthetase